MGLTKQYVRYAVAGLFNVVASQKCCIKLLELNGIRGKYCAVGACEHVIIWDLRKGEQVAVLEGKKYETSCLAVSTDKKHLAVGYTDGSINIFDLYSGEITITFSGHKSEITALRYDSDGMRLVSGSKDTDVVVWDIINESGMYRLRGHRGVITQAYFLTQKNTLITSSKDTFLKFWDLDTQHCFKTLVGHTTEVWDFVTVANESLLITGSGDMDIRVWSMQYIQDGADEPVMKKGCIEGEEADSDDEDSEMQSDKLRCQKLGSLLRQGKDRVVSLSADPSGRMLAFHGSDSLLEVFRVSSEEELKKKLLKKEKRARKRARESVDVEVTTQAKTTINLDDRIVRVATVKMAGKLRGFSCIMEKGDQGKGVCLLMNNMLESFHIDLGVKKAEAMDINKLMMPGHRSDVRTLAFSSDSTAVLSGSAESIKVWNRGTLKCIRTMQCDYALCSLFAPGDRHIIIGTKSGKLQLFDLAASVLLESIDAHNGPVWSICMAPDKRSILSGSADHDIKFWDFELITDEEQSSKSKRLTLVHTRTLQMAEDVLCVKFSPDHKLLAASLLDNTVKVFFADTLKFFLSLYGHKLPVLCMDISTDGTLIVTGSADRNVKLWGLDFGDCHKSIFAHDDSIMCLEFVPKTHMFFTGGKDGKIKQWDGDSFDQILTLEGHHAEVWCLALAPTGNFLVSGSHDKSLRLWEKTEEPLVLEEEREMEREQGYEDAMAEGGEPVIPGETNKETGIAGKKTVETVKAAERIMEAIELYKEETAKLEEHEAQCMSTGRQLEPPPLHPMFEAFNVTTPYKYMMHTLRKVKSSELEEALLVLPFSYVTDLLQILNSFLQEGTEPELSCRCLFFLLRIHQGQITSNQVLLPIMDSLRTNTQSRVEQLRDTIGFNLAGLKFLKQQIEEKEEFAFFADATDRFKRKKKKVPTATLR